MSEATALAEAPILETPVQETPQAIEPVVESPPVGDTGQPESVDAAPATNDAASLDAEYEAYVKTQESKESGEPAPEPAQQREEPQQQIDPLVYQQRRSNYEGAYRSFYATVDAAVAEMVDSGLPESQAKRIAESLKQSGNTIHATGLNFHGLEAATQASARINQAWSQAQHEALSSFVPKSVLNEYDSWRTEAEKKGNVSVADTWQKAFELRLKAEGYVSKAKHEADRKNAWVDGRRAREAAGEVNGAQSGQAVNGAAGGAMFSNADDLFTAWNDKRITRSQYAANYKRLFGRDPE